MRLYIWIAIVCALGTDVSSKLKHRPSPAELVQNNFLAPMKQCSAYNFEETEPQPSLMLPKSSGRRTNWKIGFRKFKPGETFNKLVAQPAKKKLMCTVCTSVVTTLQYGVVHYDEQELLNKLRSFCSYFIVFSKEICYSFIDTQLPSLIYIFQRSTLSADDTCGYFFPQYCSWTPTPDLDWDVKIPPQNPLLPRRRPIKYKKAKSVIKILHIADSHYDSEYVVGSEDLCKLPLCCRNPQKKANGPTAGLYGGWKCDIPERTFDSLLEFASKNIKNIDHVFWTGDVPAHDIWKQTKAHNVYMINRTMAKFQRYFPGRLSLLPSLGNHEAVPANLVPTPELNGTEWSSAWLFDLMAERWTTPWLGMSQSESIRKGANYAIEYRPGLYVISINTVYCYTFNWWLVLDSKDAGGQLEWLIKVLSQIEFEGKKAQIISHIPPSNIECLSIWRRNYNKIIERFRDTVVGQFFGHTHFDEFSITAGLSNNSDTLSVDYIGGSVTTFTMLNPGFRIYYVDGDYEGTTRKVLDYETWIMDLEQSNLSGYPIWKMLYRAKEAFGIDSLEPEQWRKVYERMKTDDNLLQMYHRFYWKDSPMRPSCSVGCRDMYQCLILNCENKSWFKLINRHV